ncbi:MAG: hypothetical protein QOJ37_2014, partial [Pseudonocardiales bacterium]|nr:hypothetical protein [Pseudonocardiales bacterium]
MYSTYSMVADDGSFRDGLNDCWVRVEMPVVLFVWADLRAHDDDVAVELKVLRAPDPAQSSCLHQTPLPRPRHGIC